MRTIRSATNSTRAFRLSPRIPTDRSEAPDRAAKLKIFELVDAIEVLNGACGEDENALALKVARHLGMAEVAGSDSPSAGSVGCVTTLLDTPVKDERDLIDAIRARRCRAGRGLLKSALVPLNRRQTSSRALNKP